MERGKSLAQGATETQRHTERNGNVGKQTTCDPRALLCVLCLIFHTCDGGELSPLHRWTYRVNKRMYKEGKPAT